MNQAIIEIKVILSSRVKSGADSESCGKSANESFQAINALRIPSPNAVKTLSRSMSAFL
jgi:hypothetical protein